MRRFIRLSAATVIAAGALTLGACDSQSDPSHRRGSSQGQQVERSEDRFRDSMPANMGSGTASMGEDPGQIQNGAPRKWGVDQPGANPQGVGGSGPADEQDPNSDQKVQGQENESPGVINDTLLPNQTKPKTHGP